jgi:hypothetical protein
MQIEISDEYIKWASTFIEGDGATPPTEEEVTEYVNEVLAEHRKSWDELSEE